MANKMISDVNGNVITTDLKQLLGSQSCSISVLGLSPCVGMSPNAVDPFRRNRIFIARSKTRASLSLNRCRHFASATVSQLGDIAAKSVCRTIVGHRHQNSCRNNAIRIVPRVAGRVGRQIRQITHGAGPSIIVARVNNAINSVRSLPFLRTVHRFHGSIKQRSILCVRIALVP